MYDNFFKPRDLRLFQSWEGYRREDPWDYRNLGHDDLVLDGSGIIMPDLRPDKSDTHCRICRLGKQDVPRIYYICTDFILMDCPWCLVPVAISTYHSRNITPQVENNIMARARGCFPNGFDLEKQSILDHLNWHIIRTEIDRQEWMEHHSEDRDV